MKKIGRPTKYGPQVVEKANEYYERCLGAAKDSMDLIPFIEQLAVELDVDGDTVWEWDKQHPEFSEAIKKIKSLQKLRLQQRSLGTVNPTGAIFLLKANHGLKDSTPPEPPDNEEGEELTILRALVNKHERTIPALPSQREAN